MPDAARRPPPPVPGSRPPVPWRTILAIIGTTLAVGLALLLLWELRRILMWLVVAAFFAVLLNPAVDFVQRRTRVRRGIAAGLVFFLGILVFAGLLYAFIRPLVEQGQEFADKLPEYVEDARDGKGPVGRLVKRYKIDDYLERNEERLQEALRGAGQPALRVARAVANTVLAVVTVLVLAFLMLLQGPDLLRGGLNMLSPPRRERISRVAADCSRAVSGYMAGNLLISIIAGTAAYVFLLILGVPFREVLALWVAFADLIPLVGATLGAVPAVGVAFIHSVPAGIATLVFFIAYQQFENHVLQVTIMSRTVDLNPLLVLVSVLVGVELFGFLGALLAIPAGGVIQVIVRDIYDERRGRLKPEPTIGTDETPVSKVRDVPEAASGP
jgi:predicted PurR-regulated permease PerM